MDIKKRIEENVLMVLAGVAIASFIAGWGVPEALRKNSGLVTVREEELNRLRTIESTAKPMVPSKSESSQKLIAVVDNVFTVYDPRSKERGRTNFDDIYDNLHSNAEFKLSRVQTYEGWADYNHLFDLSPSIVVVHKSAFYNDMNPTDEENHFWNFLTYAANRMPLCKFIVYSRSIVSTDDESRYIANMTVRDPSLIGRLFALSIPSGRTREGLVRSSFQNTSNTARLLEKINQALGVELR